LGLADEIEELEDQLIAIERQRKATEKEASKLEDQKISLRNTMDNCDDEIEKWEALEEKVNDGKTVYAPVAKTRKRKRSSSSTDSEDEDKDKDSDESDNESQSSDRGSPLTAEDIETKIQELKDQKKAARRGRSEIEAEVKELKTKIKDFKAEARNIEDNRSRICIAARNQYSKSAIQVDFAAGIKEVSRSLHMILLADLTDVSYSWTKKQPRRRTPTSTLKKNFATTRRLLKTCLSIASPVEHIRSCLAGL
jgi:chromosome segregation ATPase